MEVQVPGTNKNAESNIVNQILSFLFNESKTKVFLNNHFKDDKKVKSFNQIMNSMKKTKKKYANRKYLENWLLL